MPVVDVMDSTWVRARAVTVGAIVADPANWRRWWPGLVLRADELRKDKGVRWFVDSVAGHPELSGTAELWLQSQGDGVVAHFFLRLDPADGQAVGARDVERIRASCRRHTKRAFWALADQLDPGRLARHTSASHASVT